MTVDGEWMDGFLAEWRLELAAPEEFWLLMSEFSPSRVSLIREVIALAARDAFMAGSGNTRA